MKNMYLIGIFSLLFCCVIGAMDNKKPTPPTNASPRTPLLSKVKAAADMARARYGNGEGGRAFGQRPPAVAKPAAQKQ